MFISFFPNRKHRTILKKLPIKLLAACLLAALTVCSCTPRQTGKLTEESPTLTGYQVEAGNDGTEASQYVLLTLHYSAPLKAEKAVKKHLRLTVSDAPPDQSVMNYTAFVSAENSSDFCIRLSALPSSAAPGKGSYFALYNGNLSITSDAGETLPGLTDQSGRFAAKWSDIAAQIPSGLQINKIASTTGDSAKQIKASVTAEVAAPARIRVVTWMRLLVNGKAPKDAELTLNDAFPVHAHLFLSMTQEDFAESITEGLEAAYGDSGDFVFSCQGNQVKVEATVPRDGENLELTIYSLP